MVSEKVAEAVPDVSQTHAAKNEVDLENRTDESIPLPDSGNEKRDSEKKCDADEDNKANEECKNVSQISLIFHIYHVTYLYY